MDAKSLCVILYLLAIAFFWVSLVFTDVLVKKIAREIASNEMLRADPAWLHAVNCRIYFMKVRRVLAFVQENSGGVSRHAVLNCRRIRLFRRVSILFLCVVTVIMLFGYRFCNG